MFSVGHVQADERQEFDRLTTESNRQLGAGQYREMEKTASQMQRLAEGPLSSNPAFLALALNQKALAIMGQGRYAEAEPILKQALAIWEKTSGPDHPETATALNNLASLYDNQGRYAEAEPLLKRAVTIREKALKPDHPDTATNLNNLALLYDNQGRYAEAEPLYKRALAICEKALGPDHPHTATSLNNLALLYSNQGRYAEAEPLLKRALAIREKALGPDHPDTATSLHNLAALYNNQGRYAEAESLYKRALAVWEKALGPDHPYTAIILNNLANLYCAQSRYAEAEPLYKRALTIWEKALGPEHPDTAKSLNNLAVLYDNQGRYAEAEPLYKRALAIREKALGPDHPHTAMSLMNLASFCQKQGHSADAEPLVDRALVILERTHAAPDWQLWCYRLRAELGWQAKRRSEAIADLQRAMDLAEQLRGQSSGAAHERAEFFGTFAGVFEQMVAWQNELGDTSAVLSAIERARARSLLDDLNLSGADLDAGRSAVEREGNKQREAELKGQAAGLERQLTAAKDNEEKSRLEAELAKAREALYDHYRDQRTSSPVYRNLLAVGSGPVRLSRVQGVLAGRDALMLVYLLGGKNGYVLVLSGDAARIAMLSVDAAAAKTLGVDAGPLTAARMRAVVTKKDGGGVLQQLADPKRATETTVKMAALWQLLVPEAEQSQLIEKKYKRLFVVPDGALSLLPFEGLVVEQGELPKYLLDVAPPMAYGPSATVLYNLVERQVSTSGTKPIEPVLTVGNAQYGPVAEGSSDPLAQLAARSRYTALGGKLSPLPYTSWEIQWVAKNFANGGLKTVTLSGPQATKANLRANVAGRRIVHLACHGLADQSYGNFFGALALTPGGKANDAADDGFLTLPEIYELNLKDCELAILSACETNYGPEQRGEGVWALSRGFLVAGSRRVVASNWLVDDEAAASLVGYFCSILANAEKAGNQPDYAQALHEAKLWVRQQKKWESPYYWGTFELVGPN